MMRVQEDRHCYPICGEIIMKDNDFKSKCKISRIGVSDDTLTGRSGKVLFVKYLNSVKIYPLLQSISGNNRRYYKGLPASLLHKPCFFGILSDCYSEIRNS